MNGEFSAAGEWAETAKTFFQNASSKKYAKEIKYLDEYVKVLQERERNNVKLNEQYGIMEKR
jgi:Mg2+/Co2+ transporter CorC